MKIKIFVFTLIVSSILFSLPLRAQKTGTSINSYSNDDSYINMKEDGHTYKIRLKGNTVKELEVDGKVIPESDFNKYDAFIKRILKQMEEDRKQAEKDRKQAEKDRIQADADRIQAEKDRIQAEKDRLSAEGDRKQAEKDRAQAGLDRKQAEKDRVQAGIDRKQAEEDRKLYDQMIAELISDKLVESRAALKSITLDNAIFSINGVKQPEEVQKKYAARYLKGKSSSIRMNHSQ